MSQGSSRGLSCRSTRPHPSVLWTSRPTGAGESMEHQPSQVHPVWCVHSQTPSVVLLSCSVLQLERPMVLLLATTFSTASSSRTAHSLKMALPHTTSLGCSPSADHFVTQSVAAQLAVLAETHKTHEGRAGPNALVNQQQGAREGHSPTSTSRQLSPTCCSRRPTSQVGRAVVPMWAE